MSQHQEEVGFPVGEVPSDDDLDWTILRALLAANNKTSRAMESHLLRVYYGGEAEQTTEHIQRAIERHERIIEDLELAKEMVDRRG
jgi:hypothetical protein